MTRKRFSAPALDRDQLGDGFTPLFDHYLAALSHLVDQGGKVLSCFSNTGASHDPQSCYK